MGIEWRRHFDAIYCIHYLPFSDRVERITSELKRVGILDSGIFKWKYTFDSPFYSNLLNSDISLFHDTLRNPSMLKCTLSHYEVYKEAELLGLERILIIEDDIVFHKDVGLIESYLESIPSDYDVVMFDYFPFGPGYVEKYAFERRVNDKYAEFDTHLSSGAFYSLSKKALRFVISRQEKSLHAGDTAWHRENGEQDGIKRCFSLKHLGYQKQYGNSYTIASAGKGTMERHYSYCGLNVDEYN